MSAPQAEKYQDHYAVLGVDPKAPPETISDAYQGLAKRFHPDNPATADREKYASVTEAYETLANPGSRAAFDSLREKNMVDATPPAFSGRSFFESFSKEHGRRIALMCVLYDRRKQKPFTPSLSVRQVESIVNIPSDDLNFTIWFLKQRGWISSDDKSSLQITVDGMEHLEHNTPSYDDIAPFLRLPEPDEIAPPENTPSEAALNASLRIRRAREARTA